VQAPARGLRVAETTHRESLSRCFDQRAPAPPGSLGLSSGLWHAPACPYGSKSGRAVRCAIPLRDVYAGESMKDTRLA